MPRERLRIVFKPTATPDITGGLKVNNSVVDSNIALIDGQPSGAISSHSQSSSSAISQSAPPPAFPDVPATHPYAEAVQWAKDRGVLQGYPDGTFRPNNIVNRAEFLKIILSAQGNVAMDAAQDAEFSDVDSTAWYALFIRYAKTRGIVQGYPDGTFKPNQTVTLAEGLKIAYKALDVQTEEADGEWYERYLQHAKTNDVLFTTDIDPAQGMTRKDVVWIVWKLLGRS